jgi:F-type H+-transporting ATPase subunit epsilon
MCSRMTQIIMLTIKFITFNSELTKEADQINLPTELGEIGILPGHAHLISNIIKGQAVLKLRDKEYEYELSDGYVEVEKDIVKIYSQEVKEV